MSIRRCWQGRKDQFTRIDAFLGSIAKQIYQMRLKVGLRTASSHEFLSIASTPTSMQRLRWRHLCKLPRQRPFPVDVALTTVI